MQYSRYGNGGRKWATLHILVLPTLGVWATDHSRQTSQATRPLSASTRLRGRIESDSRACYLDFRRMTSRLTNKTFEPAFRDLGELFDRVRLRLADA